MSDKDPIKASPEAAASAARKRTADELSAAAVSPLDLATIGGTSGNKTSRLSMESASARDVNGKPYKGLRHFSMMVCRKVEEKGQTSYNEVADELVAHVSAERRKEEGPNAKLDEKNIRRRVYDALNVLMAMDIIQKDKKAISWKGLPHAAHQDIDMLERERDYRQQQLDVKREQLQELLTQQVCFRNLVEHNQKKGYTNNLGAGGGDVKNNIKPDDDGNMIPLPFIVVNTHASATIQCNMSKDKTDVMFDFSQPFEINDDNTILKRLGMDKTTMSVLREMLPDDLLNYCESHGLLQHIVAPPSTVLPPATISSKDFAGATS